MQGLSPGNRRSPTVKLDFISNCLHTCVETDHAIAKIPTKTEETMEQIRLNAGDNPQAAEHAVEAVKSIKLAAQRGSAVMIPMRESIVQSTRDAKGVFIEIGYYPQVFDLAIQCCTLFEEGLGPPENYKTLVDSLLKARLYMRAVVTSFTAAAEKAEKALKVLPTIPASNIP